jgi:large subunit ribosomal protein L24
MKKDFSKAWSSSAKQRKQRKFRAKAPAHIRGSFLNSPLSKPLKAKHGRGSVRVRKGDTVKVMRGRFKGKEGKVERVHTLRQKVNIEKLEVTRKDGAKSLYSIHPSKIMIMELNTEDKRRLKRTGEQK